MKAWKITFKNGDSVWQSNYSHLAHGEEYTISEWITKEKDIIVGSLWWKKTKTIKEKKLHGIFITPKENVLKVELVDANSQEQKED